LTEVVIMAGGRGLRMHGLTADRQKAMLEVGGRPMLEGLVMRCAAQGFTQLTMILGYRADQVRGHFGDGSSFGCSILYVEETHPGGTVGGLAGMAGPVIVHNADVVTDLDLAELLTWHQAHRLPATAVLARADYQVPFGVVSLMGNRLENVAEKPVVEHQVLAGVYVLEPSALALVRTPMDMPQLLAQVDTACYPHPGDWRDVGTLASLAAANGG
jgi:NDP-sugar pyrophosphorylase family protein